MCPGNNGSTVCLLGLPVNCAGWLRGMAATGEPWSGLNVKRTARVGWEHRETEAGACCSLNFVLLPNCPTRAHNQTGIGRETS